ncbi:MAG: DUF6279 family lipoprotein [Burkholderiales bacterium]
MKKATSRAFLVAAALAVAACSLTRVAYNNADAVARFMAGSYLDLDDAQSKDLSSHIARLHQWHRANELPLYAALLRSASRRAARGITAEDVAWGLSNVRARYRSLAAGAAEEAAPLLTTLGAAQLAALEHKFAEKNEEYAKKYLASDDAKRRRAQLERAVRRIEDFTGDLTREQEALVERFMLSHGRHVVLRFEDRQRWQRDALALLARHPGAEELGERLAQTFRQPELRRSEEFLREDRRWDEDLARLVVDLDRTLSPRQRAHLVRRLEDYAEDFAVLSGRKGEAT